MFSNMAARPARVVAAALVAGGLVLGTAACTPNTTDIYYAASDGTRVKLDSDTLEVINLMILVSEDGSSAVLHGAIHNDSTDADVATITSVDGSVDLKINVEAGDTVNLNTTESAATQLDNFSARPGESLEASFSDQAGATKTIHIPVLDGSLPEYKDSAPTN